MSNTQQRVRWANPVVQPEEHLDPAQRAAIRLMVQTRLEGPPVQIEPHPPTTRRAWQNVSVAAVLTIMVLGLGFFFVAGGAERGPAATEVTELATQYLEARNRYDAAAMLDIIDAESVVHELPIVRSVDELPLALEYLQIVEERLTTYDCSARRSPNIALCSYTASNGIEGDFMGEIVFTALDGVLVEVEHLRSTPMLNATAPSSQLAAWTDHVRSVDRTVDYWRTVYEFDVDRNGHVVATPRLTRENLDEIRRLYLSFAGR